jgi:hypothetical protein
MLLRIAGALSLAFGLAGCAIEQQSDADMCGGLKNGYVRVIEIRTDKWLWDRQHTEVAKRDEHGVCTIEQEAPASSDVIQELESPISSIVNHVVWVP